MSGAIVMRPLGQPHEALDMSPSLSTPGARWSCGSRRAYVLIACSVAQLPIWGFAMTFGILQDHLIANWTFSGSPSTAGIIGTTTNGVMYLAMPLLFALLSRRWRSMRRSAAVAGVLVASASFLLSAFASAGWHLIATQGVSAALGCALVYSATTLSLNEHYSAGGRALALGVTLSCKNVVGSTCPFLLDYLLSRHGYRVAMCVWAGVVLASGLASISFTPMHPVALIAAGAAVDRTTEETREEHHRPRRIPWAFLTHRDFYVAALATLSQSSGYGLPQTYLPSYARTTAHLSPTSSTLLLVLFNAPGIVSSAFFGLLSDNNNNNTRFLPPLGATATAAVSALMAALAALLIWGLAVPSADGAGTALLVLFAVCYGFAAGGYSATWGGTIKEMEVDAARRNEAIDTGVVYGLLNGARGVGYVVGGFIGVELLKVGERVGSELLAKGRNGYGTSYGPVMLYTGLATAFGGWSVVFKCWDRIKIII